MCYGPAKLAVVCLRVCYKADSLEKAGRCVMLKASSSHNGRSKVTPPRERNRATPKSFSYLLDDIMLYICVETFQHVLSTIKCNPGYHAAKPLSQRHVQCLVICQLDVRISIGRVLEPVIPSLLFHFLRFLTQCTPQRADLSL